MKEKLVTRYKKNPILTKNDIPYPVETVHNAGVVKFNGKYMMLFRSHLETKEAEKRLYVIGLHKVSKNMT